jgi:hypothetical protein
MIESDYEKASKDKELEGQVTGAKMADLRLRPQYQSFQDSTAAMIII